jgi:hypothetical protein
MAEQDRVQHARLVARPAARTPVERANDQALEQAILLARWGGLTVVLAGLGAVVAFAWTLDWRWAFTGLLALLVGGVAAWFGWWVHGNEGWRRGNAV